ncbi:MAG: rRNA maturation RNase YbeY [Flavipsychrobacter sp.]|nr:rRNA maturation RNase YbeY [Flavipsychrobacter sp.]
MPAKFFEQEIKSGLSDKRKLSAYLDSVVSTHLPEVTDTELTYIFCSDERLLQMNQQFLAHDTLTDIITFDMSEHKAELEGEIYISVDRVKENAEKYNVSYQNELHRVIFHGALHLCGFKDKNEEDKKIMRQKEDECLAAYLKETVHAN